MQKIELLAPARNYECGHEALLHGADAVYIGAPAFGARAAAGNSITDIERLCREAHVFGGRIYVTFNTILTDDQLEAARRQALQLYEAGVDALIVQDMALAQMDLPRDLALHASTQMDNRTPEQVRFLSDAGFEQVVLARELTLKQIADIHRAVPEAALEAFVHGALCVSFSGQCYASEYCFGRSANRGACAQFCRMAFDLVDADGRTLVRQKHLLSLRDMNRTAGLEEMMDAGISSFKIEGRLKEVSYVKNLTAWYRHHIDRILERRADEFTRASSGTVSCSFTPLPEKSFNRGFTEYFLHGRTEDVSSPDSPKSRGEYVGQVAAVGPHWLTVSGETAFSNGDGLCFTDREGHLVGFRVNRAEGSRLYPATMPAIRQGTALYRNQDQAFEHALARPTATRKLALDLTLTETPEGYRLSLSDELGRQAEALISQPHEAARTPQEEGIRRQLGKLGDTPYAARHISLRLEGNRFIPSSLLAQARREAVEKLLDCASRVERKPRADRAGAYPQTQLSYLGNVANREAAAFYRRHGVSRIEPALEQQMPEQPVLMFCRHCLRYSLGYCPTHHHRRAPWREPLMLQLADGRNFPLEFDCKNCQMKVHAPR